MDKLGFSKESGTLRSGGPMLVPFPQTSRRQVNIAAQGLELSPPWSAERWRAQEIINNWRSCHAYPLQIVKMTLLKRARSIDSTAIIAQRLKRMASINLKLKRNPNMQMTQMQDIAGCRAVLRKVAQVDALAEKYRESSAKGRGGRPELIETYDYISNPKHDGYRSLHLVFKYQSRSTALQPLNGLRVEIQIRSQLQHFWATAVETVSTFTGDSLKAKASDLNHEWVRFFSLMSSALALKERRTPVPGTPTNRQELISCLRECASKLRVDEVLSGWGNAAQWIEERQGDSHNFLLVLDADQRKVSVTSFGKSDGNLANVAYAKKEKENEGNSNLQTVLVSVDSIAALRSAYPNYYLDTSAFIEELRSLLR